MSTSIQGYFHIEHAEEIQKFFHEKNDFFSFLESQVHRLQHFIWTGVWINESLVYSWADTPQNAPISPYLKGRSIYRETIRHETNMAVPARTLMDKVQSVFSFFLEFVKHPGEVGSIIPSSVTLAKALVKSIARDVNAPPRMLLEVGPGEDADPIIKRMNPQDTLHLVEYNETFCNVLKARYQHLKNVHVFHRSILDHKDIRYDYIVSGLPLTAFPAAMVEKIFQKFEELSARDAKLSYFEYPCVKHIAHFFSTQQERECLERINLLKHLFYEKHKGHVVDVMYNIPPARVKHHVMHANAIERTTTMSETPRS